MKLEKITTADGSSTLALVGQNEQYHSKHGALQEALHVYVNSGLDFYLETNHNQLPVKILEVGFGTGLNSLLSSFYAQKSKIELHYYSLEAYPLSWKDVKDLNYPEVLNISKEKFQHLHNLPWGEIHNFSDFFQLKKLLLKVEEITFRNQFQIVFFDAFGPRTQPEIWSLDVFTKLYIALQKKGVLVTYSANGQVRRNMQAAGFHVEKIPGPPGKREMLRAIKK